MSDESLLGQLAEEFIRRARAGELPDVEEYASAHPELAGRIRELFPTLMLLEGMADTGVSAAAQAAPAPLSSGSIFGHYRIEREVGRGGMGIVYEAVHVLLEKRVALKVLPARTPADAGNLERFFREARTAAGLHHTNIVPVFDVGQVASTPYFAMQCIEGRGLDRILRLMQLPAESDSATLSSGHDARPSPREDDDEAAASPVHHSANPSARIRAGLPAKPEDYFRWVAGIGIQAAEGLPHAHERKVIHHDVKPSNLLLDDQRVLWIADFGLARRIEDPAMTQSGALLGTPRYMSPEQAQATKYPVDERSDIYSLGATLYELLACQPVFEGKTPQDVLWQILAREPAPLRRLSPDIPVDLAAIVMKATAKRREDRYQSARYLADDLQRWRKMKPIKARPIGPLGHTIRWCRRNPRVAAVTAIAAAVIVALTGIYLSSLTNKNREIQAALNRAQLGVRRAQLITAVERAVIGFDTRDYIDRAAELRKVDKAILGKQKIELLPSAVNHLFLLRITPELDTETVPDIERHVRESEEQALDLTRLAVAERDSRFAESSFILGSYFHDINRDIDRAERLYREALALMEPVDNQRRLKARLIEKLIPLLDAGADLAMESAAARRAAALYREALQLGRDNSSQDDSRNEILLERKLGLALTDSGQFEEAKKALLHNYRRGRTSLGDKHLETQMAASGLISLYAAWNKDQDRIADYAAVPPAPRVIGVRELGRKPFTASGSGPFSASWAGKQVWIYGHDVPTLPELQSSSWLWSEAGQQGDKLGPLQQSVDIRGQPVPLLPLTADEREFNRARSAPSCLENCDEHWSLIPGTVVPLPRKQEALLFYYEHFFRTAFEGTSTIGSSMAIWRDPTAPAIRDNLRPGTSEPTPLFQTPEPKIGAGALVGGGYVYAYGTRYLGPGNERIIAPAPLDQARQRSASRFYIGQGRWDSDWRQAVIVSRACVGTVHCNWYLRKYVIFCNLHSSTRFIGTADRPEGPWSRPQEVQLGKQPISALAGSWMVIWHPDLSKERGALIYLTYQQGTGMFRSDTRLINYISTSAFDHFQSEAPCRSGWQVVQVTQTSCARSWTRIFSKQ